LLGIILIFEWDESECGLSSPPFRKESSRSLGIKQFILELGGGDPAFVLDDADVNLAASKIATGITSFSGQRCDAVKIVFVEGKIYGEFKKLLVDQLSVIRVGDPRNPDTDIGPLSDEATAIEFVKAVEEAIESGGELIYGGGRRRNYVQPALVEVRDWEVLTKLKVFRDEIFAPIAVMTSFDDLDEAIEVANERRYGLDAAVFGRDINRIRKLVRMLDVGAVYINEYPRHGIGYYPFGGRKESGVGREGIGYSIEYVTAIKTIVYNYKGKEI
jgi:glyceraldehyde-3-phosphate dehydrogenase [NAD(P)+]